MSKKQEVKRFYVIREDDSYFLCQGYPKPCKKYQTAVGSKHYYTFSGCDCIPVSREHLTDDVQMGPGDEPLEAGLVIVGNNRLKNEITKWVIRNK
jgi:hypothetical protein